MGLICKPPWQLFSKVQHGQACFLGLKGLRGRRARNKSLTSIPELLGWSNQAAIRRTVSSFTETQRNLRDFAAKKGMLDSEVHTFSYLVKRMEAIT